MKKILIALAIALAFGCTKKPNDVSKDFAQNIVDGKTDAAFKSMVPNFSMMSESGVKNWLGENSAKLKAEGIKNIEIVKSQEENDVSVVELKLTNQKNQSLNLTLRLQKQDGKWLISEVR
ncbi:MAG: DUF4878 domain-containing protein [Bdellovibrio sp.]|nr:DUF4878 domain-containing protein [Bdellovibrio sp.]